MDCTDKQKILNDYLITEVVDPLFEEEIQFPMLDLIKLKLNENLLLELVAKLEIDIEYIERKFKEANKEIANFDFFILRTDWYKYRFNTDSLSNMHFEMLHAFLLHPYLTADTIKHIHLNFKNILGLASDITSLNNPLSYVNPVNAIPLIENQYRIALNRGMIRGLDERVSDDFLEGHLFDLDISPINDLSEIENPQEFLKGILRRKNIQLDGSVKVKIGKDLYSVTSGNSKYIIEKKDQILKFKLIDDRTKYFLMNAANLNQVSNGLITPGNLVMIPVESLSEPTAIVLRI